VRERLEAGNPCAHGRLNTEAARQMARHRMALLAAFVAQARWELRVASA
jgi:hypothetical protein